MDLASLFLWFIPLQYETISDSTLMLEYYAVVNADTHI